MKKNFKISVITVTKNSEKFLEENINSLKNQTYKNFEHIIIDGNSTDRTVEIIKKNKDNFFVGMNDFGASAPAGDLYEHFGITERNVINKVKEKFN